MKYSARSLPRTLAAALSRSRAFVLTCTALAALLVVTLGGPLPARSMSPSVPAEAGTVEQARDRDRPARVKDGCVKSVPFERGIDARVDICYTLFRPAGASRRDPVPVVMHSHGWGGSRTTDPAEFRRWLRAGYAVLSFDQRGFGESGGRAHVHHPAVEGRDVARLVRLLSRKRWIQQDGRRDPRLGAIGGSYGGGYQFLGAFTHLQRRGKPVFDVLAPEITWHSLIESLAPEDVVRTEWALALSAAAVPSDALPPHVYKALAEGAATGTWPDGSVPGTENLDRFFRRNGPSWHVGRGRRLDIPMVLGQGTTDTLFPLRQGIRNWERALTRRARRQSIFVGYNGGHVLPSVFPRGVEVTSDPCSQRLVSGAFADLARRFFDRHLKGERVRLRGEGKLHIATRGSRCTTVPRARPNHEVPIGRVATTEAAGAPLAFEIAEGPLRVAGSVHLTARVTALGASNRAFYGLGIGTSPATATLVQNNVLPLREEGPVLGERRRIPLPAVAVDVPPGQNLYLIASPVSDTFVGMSSRTPGAIVLEETFVHFRRVGG